MKIFKWEIRPAGEFSILEKELSLQKSISDELVHQNRILKQKVDGNKLVGIIDVDIGDPTPDKIEQRREYVAKVAGFYKDVLKSKLLQMISVFHKLLEEETNDRETDLYLKIGTFICRDLMKWGDQAISEQMSYQTEPPPTAQERKEALPN
jgi:hypothetical protein